MRVFTALLILMSYISVYADNHCEECEKFKIVGVFDFIPPPAGNNLVLLLTVTEDLENQIGGFYSDLFFVNSSGDTITNRLGASHTLPTITSDTIPYSMILSTELRNQDFPTDFDGKLVIETPSLPPCVGFTVCNIPYSNVVTNVTESQPDLSLQVYPNPCTDYVNINTSKPIQNVDLFDMNSNRVLAAENLNNIDISHLSTGYYLMKITFNDNSTIYKSVLKH